LRPAGGAPAGPSGLARRTCNSGDAGCRDAPAVPSSLAALWLPFGLVVAVPGVVAGGFVLAG